jgi:hypothetical protein
MPQTLFSFVQLPSTVAKTSGKLSQFASTTSAELAGVIGDETGSGPLVFASSPTLVTPDLGTPSALTLTNATGLPQSGVTNLVSDLALKAPLMYSRSRLTWWTPTNAANGLWINGIGAASGGTFSNVSPGTVSRYDYLNRSAYANVVTTTNQSLGVTQNSSTFFRNSSSSFGGYSFYARAGFETWANGGRFFVGLCTSSTAAVTGEPSAHNNSVGFAVDSTDNGAIFFQTRGTSTTRAATGFTCESGNGFEMFLSCAAGGSSYSWRIVNINTGAEVSGTATLNLPSATASQRPAALAGNAALTTASAIVLGVSYIYIE